MGCIFFQPPLCFALDVKVPSALLCPLSRLPDAVAERGARGRPESLRDVNHHAHQAERAHHQG